MADHDAGMGYRPRVIIAGLLAILALGLKIFLDVPEFADPEVVGKSLRDSLGVIVESVFTAAIIYLGVLVALGRTKDRPAESTEGAPLERSSPEDRPAITGDVENRARADAFIGKIDLTTVTEIDVLAITGEITIRQLCGVIERSEQRKSLNLKMRILLRSDSSSDSRRITSRKQTRATLHRARQAVGGLDYEIRHYSSVCPLRGIILKHKDDTYSAYLSHYDWRGDETMTGRESSTPWAYLRNNVKYSNELLMIYRSWFEQFWGKHRIHTLIFDFDDTLFQTTNIQVNAWISAIKTALSTGAIVVEMLSPEIRLHLDNSNDFRDLMTEIFLDEQQEARIFSRVFSVSLDDNRLDIVRKMRLEVREKETIARAKPILEITEHISKLRENFQLVIVSATSENVINEVLDKNKLNFFSFIFGKEALHNWRDIEGKTPTFITVSNMLGIPLDRMAFIGDSDADYRAARQLGLKFIESRINAAEFGRSSLITSRSHDAEAIVVGGDTRSNLLTAIAHAEAAAEMT